MTSDVVLTVNHRGRYFVRRDDFIGRIFMEGGHFEDACLSRVLAILDDMPGRNAVDVGANLGSHTVPYANRTGATVYAFEPQKIAYDLLLRNIAINGCRNVVPYRIALGHRNRLATTLGEVYELHGRVKSLKEPHAVHNYGGIGLGRGSEVVTMMTLDSYQLDNIGLVKIDVEGAERLVLRGAARTIERQRPYVIFEQHTAGLEAIFQARWNEMCEMYSLPLADGKASMFDLLTTEFGYPEIQRIDENNYLAIP